MSAAGPDHFAEANRIVSYADVKPKNPDLGDVIVAINALTLATLAQAAATAATIQDPDQRKKWSRVIGR